MLALSESWLYFAASLVLSSILVPLMRRVSFLVGAVDRGAGRRVHTGIIPRLGGIGFYLAFIIPALLSLTVGARDDTHEIYAGVLAGSLVIVLIGLYDDLKGAKVSHKLIAEVAAAVIIYAWGIRIERLTIPFAGEIFLGWMSLPVTVLWIVIITNAMNLIDGLDGLAAGTGICIAMTFLFTADASLLHLQLTCVILIGALAGFLIYNFPPASIFMGDAGSLFIGFLLGALSIRHSFKATALATMMVPMVAFSIPLMDMAYAVVRRYYRGLALGTPDREHIHHKLLDMGLSKRKVIGIIYTINILIMLVAFFTLRQYDHSSLWAIGGLVLFAVASIRLLGYQKFLPLLKDMRRNMELNRKRRYYSFVIRKFRHQAAKAGSVSELKEHLQNIIELFEFRSAMIYVYSFDTVVPFLDYGRCSTEDDGLLVISVPLMANGALGVRIDITKEMDDDYLLCTSELFNAISEAIGRVMTGEQFHQIKEPARELMTTGGA